MEQFFSKVGAAAKSAAAGASTLASAGLDHTKKAAAAARTGITQAAASLSANHASQLVGSEVVVRGKVLKIDALLAEGACVQAAGAPASPPLAATGCEPAAEPRAPQWPCGVCTLLNRHRAKSCEACGAARPRP